MLANLLSTIGLVIDIAAVLGLFLLAQAEWQGRFGDSDPGILHSLKGKWRILRSLPAHFRAYATCLLGLLVGSGLMIAGFWLD